MLTEYCDCLFLINARYCDSCAVGVGLRCPMYCVLCASKIL